MDISKMIKRLLLERDSTAADLAGRLDTSRANISQRLKRNTWTVADLEQIAAAYGCGVVVGFVLPDGQTIMQTVPTGSIPAGPAAEIRQPPETCPHSPSPAEHPAPEQAARKSPEPPKREQRKPEDLDALIEQKQRKLAEQVAEMQRQAEAKAEKEAKEEAERQNLREEIQKAVQQYAIQFNREQARLAGEGKKFKEWDDLYEQNRNDILHAAKFRHYQEVFTLQELTPRERMARGFPMFDEEPRKS